MKIFTLKLAALDYSLHLLPFIFFYFTTRFSIVIVMLFNYRLFKVENIAVSNQ